MTPRQRHRALERARAALLKLEPADRAALLKELKPCACDDLGKLARVMPEAVVGAVVGGIVGVFMGVKR